MMEDDIDNGRPLSYLSRLPSYLGCLPMSDSWILDLYFQLSTVIYIQLSYTINCEDNNLLKYTI